MSNLLLVVVGFLMASNVDGQENLSSKLVYLGQVDGKLFFYTRTLPEYMQNWTGARGICQSENMTLAEIETEEEYQFLRSQYSQDGFSSEFWVGGRDVNTPQQFKWDVTGNPMGEFLDWNYEASILTCVKYSSNPTYTNGNLQLTNCLYSLFAICQADLAK